MFNPQKNYIYTGNRWVYIYNIIKIKFVIIRYLGTYTVKKKLCNRTEINKTGHNDTKHLRFIHEFETC